MDIQTIVEIRQPHTVHVDCFGCDFLKTKDVVTKRGYLGIGAKTSRKHICGLLFKNEGPLELTDYQVNASNLKKEECPCKFQLWRQTNAEMDEFLKVPTYRYSLSKGGDLMTLEVPDTSFLSDKETKGDK